MLTNILAYYDTKLNDSQKRFIVQTLGLYDKTNYSCNKFRSLVSKCLCIARHFCTRFNKHSSLVNYGINYSCI
jgi:hypothetical protein